MTINIYWIYSHNNCLHICIGIISIRTLYWIVDMNDKNFWFVIKTNKIWMGMAAAAMFSIKYFVWAIQYTQCMKPKPNGLAWAWERCIIVCCVPVCVSAKIWLSLASVQTGKIFTFNMILERRNGDAEKNRKFNCWLLFILKEWFHGKDFIISTDVEKNTPNYYYYSTKGTNRR